MPRSLRYLFIVLALIGLGFAIWTGIPRRPQAAEEGVAPRAVVPDGPTESGKLAAISDTAGERVETAPESEARKSEAPNAAAASDAPTESANTNVAKLTARFVDALGNPWPGVVLSDSQPDGVSATSDAAGRVALEVPQLWSETSWTVELIARRKGCATRQLTCVLTLGGSTSLGDVVLAPGVDVHGRTVDETGAGISATVGKDVTDFDTTDLTRRPYYTRVNLDSKLAVRSDPNDGFVLEGLPAGDLRLWAKGEETHMIWSDKLTLVEGVDLAGVVLTVPRPRDDELITGVVLNPDGRPARDAFVSCAYVGVNRSGSTGMMTGTDGRFRILVEPGYATFNLTATDPEQRYSSASLRDVTPGARDVELRLLEQQRFYVELRGPSGEPVDHCSMRMQLESGSVSWMVAPANPKSIGNGRHQLIAPTTRFRLEIEVEGCRTHRSESLDPPLPGSTLQIQLVRPDVVRGRVLAEGKPAVGAKVSSFKDAVHGMLNVNGFRSLHTPIQEFEAATKTDGTFELTYDGEATLWIRVELSGFAPTELGPLDPASSPALAFELVRGGVIEGVVILPGGVDAEGTVVGISRCDGFPRTQRAGPGGRFRFENLTPGPWQVMRRERDFDSMSISTSSMPGPVTPIEWSCEVRDGRTTRFDLDLSRP